jgi:hypothetical protein
MKKLIFALLALCFLFFVATNGQNSCYSGSSTSNNAPNSTTPLTTGNVCATYDLTCQINSSQCTQQQQLQGTCIHVYSAISQSNCNSLIDSPDVYNVVCCDTNLCNVPSGENPTCQYQYCYSGVMTSNLAPQGQLLLGSGQSCVRYDFVCNSNYNSSCTAQEQQSGVCKVYYGVVETSSCSSLSKTTYNVDCCTTNLCNGPTSSNPKCSQASLMDLPVLRIVVALIMFMIY